MNDDPSTSALELFDALVELPPGDRAHSLNARCDDERVRREVRSLLAAYDDAGRFLSEPSARAARTDGDGRSHASGDRIGSYELLELLGEGGFAQVYRARQHHPVRRDVALKLIKLGMDTRQVLARFELERQALAMMDHPGIAAVYDAGVTEAGRPYFVMELVRGQRINGYCDEHRLGVRDRVRLFIDVCRAVQHAHTKGILHRDLKPSNILVTEVDGRATPKVIDFGVAKATQERLTDATAVTHERQFLGTPQYMSPEQALSGGADVDTRGDVYSLGAVLYELLTGASPLDDERSGGKPTSALEQLQRLTGDHEVMRPSARGLDPQRRRELRGELDWIVARCLEKDRARRYESAAALADDLEAYLGNRPVTAAPPTLSYRARKFARRNTAAVVASIAIVAALMVGTVVSTAQAIRARRAERLAASRLIESQAANQNLQAVNDFLTRDMIGSADPAVTLGRDLSVRDALDNAARAISGRFPGSPATEAAVRDSVAMAYLTLGKADLALPHAQASLAQRRDALGQQHPDTIAAMEHLARVLGAAGKYDEADDLYRRALAASRAALGEDDRRTIATLDHWGDLLSSAGRLAEADQISKDANDRATRVLGPDNRTTLATAHNRALVLHRLGRSAEAETLLRDTLDRSRRVRGADDPDTLASINVLALVLSDLGRRAEAEVLHRESLESRRRVLGPDHPAALTAQHNYVGVLLGLGRTSDAERELKDVLERRRRVQGNDHPETLAAVNAYAEFLRSVNRPAEAAPLHTEALAARRRVLGDDHSDTITSMSNYAVVLVALRRFDEAERLHVEAVERARRTLGEDHPLTLTVANNLAGMYTAQGRHAEAEPIQRRSLEAWRRVRGPDHPNTIFAENNLGTTLRALKRDAEAEPLYADVYTRAQRAQIPPALAATLIGNYGPTLVRLGKFEQAEAPLLEAHRRLRETNQSANPRMRDVLTSLVTVCERTNRPDDASKWRAALDALPARPTTTPATAPTTTKPT